jgi:hypothetical protein
MRGHLAIGATSRTLVVGRATEWVAARCPWTRRSCAPLISFSWLTGHQLPIAAQLDDVGSACRGRSIGAGVVQPAEE